MSQSSTPALSVQDVHHWFGSNRVLGGVNFDVAAGQIVAVVGPSGCGKTTVLRSIAGFESAWRGRIVIDSVEVSRRKFSLPPEQRNIGMVFQDFALFPHLRVDDNVGFGLQQLSRRKQQARVQEMLAIVGMPTARAK